MVPAPGHPHLQAIEILHRDNFLVSRYFVPRHCASARNQLCNRGYPDSYRDRGSDHTCTPAFDLQKRGRRDTRNAHKTLYPWLSGGKKCAIPLFWEKSGNTTSPYCRAVSCKASPVREFRIQLLAS